MELIQKARTADFILSLGNGTLSLENAILAAGIAQAGTVLGAARSAGAAAAVGTPVGNGVITVGALGASAQIGTYSLVCIAEAANAGTFNLIAPDGSVVRQVTVAGGAAPNDHVTVTIADGSNDFDIGDTFAIEVSSDGFKPLDPEGTDGSQHAAAVLYDGADATEAPKACVVVARVAEVKVDGLIWPEDITDGQKATAIARLAAREIHLR